MRQTPVSVLATWWQLGFLVLHTRPVALRPVLTNGLPLDTLAGATARFSGRPFPPAFEPAQRIWTFVLRSLCAPARLRVVLRDDRAGAVAPGALDRRRRAAQIRDRRAGAATG